MDIQYKIITTSNQIEVDQLLLPIVACDQHVFGHDASWCEGKICLTCSSQNTNPAKWTFDTAPTHCPTCHQILADFFPLDQLLASYKLDATRKDYLLIVAYHGQEVVGGCRGWSMSIEELDQHLNQESLPHQHTTPSIQSVMTERFPEDSRVAYECSIFVREEYQGQNIGKELITRFHQLLFQRGLSVFVMRTKTDPPAASFPWYRDRLGYQELCRYDDADKRIILAKKYMEYTL